MIAHPLAFVSIFIGAWLTFLSTAFVVEAVLYLSRGISHRARACLRTVPFFVVAGDLIVTQFSEYHWLNPLSCNSCVQQLLLPTFFPDLHMYLTIHEISLLKYLALDAPNTPYVVVVGIFLSVSAFLLLRKVFQVLFTLCTVRSLMATAAPCPRPIFNLLLMRALQERSAKLMVSTYIDSPIATRSDTIIIPKQLLETISQQEFEAIIAHELEHLRWHDSTTRLFLQLVATLFWWVPTASLVRKTEQEQEMACDYSIFRYGLEVESFVSALLKVGRHAVGKCRERLCAFVDGAHPVVERLRVILGSGYVPEKFFTLAVVGVAVQVLLLLLCYVT